MREGKDNSLSGKEKVITEEVREENTQDAAVEEISRGRKGDRKITQRDPRHYISEDKGKQFKMEQIYMRMFLTLGKK